MVTMHIFDALKELFVQTDVVSMLRQDRTHLLGQLIHLIGGLCRKKIKEHSGDTRQKIVVAFAILLVIDTDNGIIKGRFLGVIDDLLNLLVVTTNTFQHGLLVVLQTDAIKGGRVMGRAIRLEEGVLSLII